MKTTEQKMADAICHYVTQMERNYNLSRLVACDAAEMVRTAQLQYVLNESIEVTIMWLADHTDILADLLLKDGFIMQAREEDDGGFNLLFKRKSLQVKSEDNDWLIISPDGTFVDIRSVSAIQPHEENVTFYLSNASVTCRSKGYDRNASYITNREKTKEYMQELRSLMLKYKV